MNRNLCFLLLLLPLKAFAQPCVPERIFLDSCETAVANTTKFLSGAQLSDAQHRNIIVCYNQLFSEFGEDGLRLQFSKEEYTEYFGIHHIEPFSATVNPFLSDYRRLFDALKSNYGPYIDSLETIYETGFGKGGALWFPQLKVDAKTADGRTYLTLCYEDPVERLAPDLVGTWEIRAWYLHDISGLDDREAASYIGKTIVFTPSQLITPFDGDSAVCISAYYTTGYIEEGYAVPFGLKAAGCLKYIVDFGNWTWSFRLPDEHTLIYERDGGVFLCCKLQ